MNSHTAALAERAKIVFGTTAIAAGATTVGDGDYVSMKNYQRCSILILVDNATTVTGGAITLLQATKVDGTNAKALALPSYWANTDISASDTLVKTDATANTFTTSTTDNKNQLFVINVDAEALDGANDFDCIRVDSASMANAVWAVVYVLEGARYASATPPAAITD